MWIYRYDVIVAHTYIIWEIADTHFHHNFIFLPGDVCPPKFQYIFGTCVTRLDGERKDDYDKKCKDITMGAGKTFIMPHVSAIHNVKKQYIAFYLDSL